MAGDFERFIEDIVRKRYNGVNQALAKALGVSPSAFGRSVKNGSLNVENLLALAKEIGESPDRVLRLAGKTSIADLIADLYGAAKPPVSQIDRQLLSLPLAVKKAVVASQDAIDGIQESPPAGARTGTGTRRSG